jgi:hypothetical protein
MHTKKVITLLLCLILVVVLSTWISLSSMHGPSPAVLAKTLVADPEYLKDCRLITGSRQSLQLDYFGVFPGQSTDEDVKILIGNPSDQHHIEKKEEWVYTGFNMYIEDKVVTSIYVHEDRTIMLKLKDVISKYGCPD